MGCKNGGGGGGWWNRGSGGSRRDEVLELVPTVHFLEYLAQLLGSSFAPRAYRPTKGGEGKQLRICL